MMVPCSAPDHSRPARALLVALLVLSPVVFWYSLLEPFEACKSTLTQLTALALLVLGVAAVRGRNRAWCRERLRDLFGGPVGVAVLAGVAAAVLSTAFSISPRTSLQGAMDSSAGLGSVFAFAVLFAATRAVCTDAGDAEHVLGAAVVGTAIAYGYAAVQALGGDPVAWEQTSGFSGWVRPSGTQGHPNYLAGHAVMALPLVAWLLRRAIERRQPARAAAAAALALLAGATILVSLSRAAWLAGVVVAVLLAVNWRAAIPRRAFLLGACLSACLLALGMANGSLRQAVVRRIQQQGSSPGRRAIWKAAFEMFRDRPWTGSGLDTFRLAYPLMRSPEYWEVEWGLMPTKAHNDFLDALATQGLPGGAAYLMLPAALLVAGLRRWREGRDRPWLAALGTVVTAYYVQNVFGFTVASTSALLAVVAGVVAGSPRARAGEADSGPAGGYLLATALGIGIVLAGLWQGRQDGEVWGFVLTAGAMAAAAAVGLVAIGIRFPSLRIHERPQLSPAALVWALAGLAGAWYLLCPLAASYLSYRADAEFHAEAASLAGHGRAVRLAPGHAIFHARRSHALLRAASLQPDAARRERLLRDSLACIETACLLQPLLAGHQADRAGVLLELARQGLAEKEDVLAAYDRALELDRCDWRVWADAARAATTLGRLDAAERYLEASLPRQPRLGMLHAERGALALARGRLAEAERILWQARSKEWHGDFERFDRALLLFALTLLQRGKAAVALETADEVLGRHGDWAPAWWLHAVAREKLGQRAAALREFRHVLRCQPDHAQARAGVERLSGNPKAER
jgi:O-antigen ligase/tetratricopeptide (TPR) repeat protein